MSATAGDEVYVRLLDDIREGAAEPGSPIREENVAERFGVSRTPVREALRRLAHDGLLERSSRGFVVTRLTPRKITEIYSIVGALEALATQEATMHATERDLVALDALHTGMGEALAAGDTTHFIHLNRRFHAGIIGASNNESLIEGIDHYATIMRHYRNVALSMPGRTRESYAEHEAILRALHARDAAAAESAMRYHLDQARSVLAAVLAAALSVSSLPSWTSQREGGDGA